MALWFTHAGLVPIVVTDEEGIPSCRRDATLEEVSEWLDEHRWDDPAHAPRPGIEHEEWRAYQRAYIRLMDEQGGKS